MSFHDFSIQNVSIQFSVTNLYRRSFRTEKRDVEKLTGDRINVFRTPEPSLIIAPIVLLAISGLIILNKLQLLHQAKKLNYLDEFPCKNCRFFSKNSYLKCAVNPSTVFTKAAINCNDYHPLKNSKKIRFNKNSEPK